jgi:iron uptake system EfeUOB component EfeO/EfeM
LQVFQGVLARKDRALLGTLRARFAAVDATLVPYQLVDGGWRPFTALTKADGTALRARLAALAASLAELPTALGVA